MQLGHRGKHRQRRTGRMHDRLGARRHASLRGSLEQPIPQPEVVAVLFEPPRGIERQGEHQRRERLENGHRVSIRIDLCQ
jgi:hypothetical protein